MKCAVHSEIDAIGVCVDCGKGLCPECKIELLGRLYCQFCANEAFRSTKTSGAKVSGWYYILPVFLGFIGGLIAFFAEGNYRKNKNRAKNMLGLGILMSILWSAFWIAVTSYEGY